MTKKQKKVLIRIIVAAVLIIALQFSPIRGIYQIYLLYGAVSGNRIRRTAQSNQGYSEQTGI